MKDEKVNLSKFSGGFFEKISPNLEMVLVSADTVRYCEKKVWGPNWTNCSTKVTVAVGGQRQ